MRGKIKKLAFALTLSLFFASIFALVLDIRAADDRLTRAYEYLLSRYNPALGLISESEDERTNEVNGTTANNTYWVYSDNLWAAEALKAHNSSIANSLSRTVQSYRESYGKSMLYEVVLGEIIPTTIQSGKKLVAFDGTVNGNWAQILLASHQYTGNSEGTLHDPEEYADFCFYMTIAYWMLNDTDASEHWFRMGESHWNYSTNNGFYDKASRQDGVYQNMKLGLFLLAQRATEFESYITSAVEIVAWRSQVENGGIATLSYLNGSVSRIAGTEATSILLLSHNSELIEKLRRPGDTRDLIGSLDILITSERPFIDSGDNTTVSVAVTEGANPVANASVSLHCERGSFSPGGGTTDNHGQISFTYVSPKTDRTVALTVYAVASKPGYLDGGGSLQIEVNPIAPEHHAQIHTVSLPAFTIIGQKMRLNVQVKNPADFDLNVSIQVKVENASVFPSAMLDRRIPPATSATPYASYLFDSTPLNIGEFSLEVQAWQNVTMVDSDLLTFTVFESMDPTLRSFWWLLVGGFSAMLWAFTVIMVLNPAVEWPKKIEITKEPFSIGKRLVTSIITLVFVGSGYSLANSVPTYYRMIPYFIPLVGKIDIIIGIGVFLSALALVFLLRKRYFVSSLIGDTLLLLVVFSLVWNTFLVPIFPLTLSQSIGLQILVTFSLKALFMVLEWAWKKTRHDIEAS